MTATPEEAAPFLPRAIGRVQAPPIKCQGIKTRLVPFIAAQTAWSGEGRWIEPFLGSGVVALNLRPARALLSDTNRPIITFYQELKDGTLDEARVREYLAGAGAVLAARGADYYYEVREAFNREGGSLRLLFLSRSCFNGVMRFNQQGAFNVPFGHKPGRFRPAYVTKIANQVRAARLALAAGEWTLRCADWRAALAEAQAGDFVYLDPPYIGRHTDYYNRWGEAEAAELARAARALPCGVALSMWLENAYRRNGHLEEHWAGFDLRSCEHYYHVGATRALRGAMREALALGPPRQEEAKVTPS